MLTHFLRYRQIQSATIVAVPIPIAVAVVVVMVVAAAVAVGAAVAAAVVGVHVRDTEICLLGGLETGRDFLNVAYCCVCFSLMLNVKSLLLLHWHANLVYCAAFALSLSVSLWLCVCVSGSV